MHTVLENHF